jgi:hypothetical protein
VPDLPYVVDYPLFAWWCGWDRAWGVSVPVFVIGTRHGVAVAVR